MMYNAAEARELQKLHNWKVIEKAIDKAVKRGNPLCYVDVNVTDKELARLSNLGYRTNVDQSGVLWVYWGMLDQLGEAG